MKKFKAAWIVFYFVNKFIVVPTEAVSDSHLFFWWAKFFSSYWFAQNPIRTRWFFLLISLKFFWIYLRDVVQEFFGCWCWIVSGFVIFFRAQDQHWIAKCRFFVKIFKLFFLFSQFEQFFDKITLLESSCLNSWQNYQQ